MKRILSLLPLLLAAVTAFSQQKDSASLIVQRYFDVVHFGNVYPDSMLYIESKIFDRDEPGDTLILRRWHIEPKSNRVELWHKGELGIGLIGNSTGIYSQYNADHKEWSLVTEETFLDAYAAYDYHGPLWNWRHNGIELFYSGKVDFKGNPAYRIFVTDPVRYDRYYIFEKQTGLLFLIHELDGHHPDMTTNNPKVDWRAIHEYTPVGRSYFPSVESYQSQEHITIINHTYKYLPIDEEIFKTPSKEKRKK